jgi:hypothetical protein
MDFHPCLYIYIIFSFLKPFCGEHSINSKVYYFLETSFYICLIFASIVLITYKVNSFFSSCYGFAKFNTNLQITIWKFTFLNMTSEYIDECSRYSYSMTNGNL